MTVISHSAYGAPPGNEPPLTPGTPPIVETVTGGIVGGMASRKRIYDAEFC
ncbi:hypothetical protein GCM10017771_76580 [Streptomyces capitiformicae]|uniref:Uncharacterized protein n=1 Tax=Streptomyces capitiformicae TaxID=2014920 RepID=A0A918ZI64_9ACTN|nr:hypothetical protein GCM10017771_76580 [Streptomyces capitiformicae]